MYFNEAASAPDGQYDVDSDEERQRESDADGLLRDPYVVLGVARDASMSAIKAAKKRAVLRHHPDKGDGDRAQFDDVTDAYTVLLDPQLRTAYDHAGHAGVRRVRALRLAQAVSSEAGTAELLRRIRELRSAERSGREYERLNYRGSIRATFDATNLFRHDGGLLRDAIDPLTDVERMLLYAEMESDEVEVVDEEGNPFLDDVDVGDPVTHEPLTLDELIVPATQWVELSAVSMSQQVDLHLGGGKKAGRVLTLAGNVQTQNGLGSGTIRLGYQLVGVGRPRSRGGAASEAESPSEAEAAHPLMDKLDIGVWFGGGGGGGGGAAGRRGATSRRIDFWEEPDEVLLGEGAGDGASSSWWRSSVSALSDAGGKLMDVAGLEIKSSKILERASDHRAVLAVRVQGGRPSLELRSSRKLGDRSRGVVSLKTGPQTGLFGRVTRKLKGVSNTAMAHADITVFRGLLGCAVEVSEAFALGRASGAGSRSEPLAAASPLSTRLTLGASLNTRAAQLYMAVRRNVSPRTAVALRVQVGSRGVGLIPTITRDSFEFAVPVNMTQQYDPVVGALSLLAPALIGILALRATTRRQRRRGERDGTTPVASGVGHWKEAPLATQRAMAPVAARHAAQCEGRGRGFRVVDASYGVRHVESATPGASAARRAPLPDIELDVTVPVRWHLAPVAEAEAEAEGAPRLSLALPARTKALLRGFAALPMPAAAGGAAAAFEPVLRVRWVDEGGSAWCTTCPDGCALELPVPRSAHDATRAGLERSEAYARTHVCHELQS
jgi:hypothetical protein